LSSTPTPESPLAGITVIELGQFIAGPFGRFIPGGGVFAGAVSGMWLNRGL